MRFVTRWLGFALLILSCAAVQARVYLGNESLDMRDFGTLRGKRVGLLTNPSGVDGRGRSVINILHKSPKVNLVALFGATGFGLAYVAVALHEMKPWRRRKVD